MSEEQIIESAIQGHASMRDAIRWAIRQERKECAQACTVISADQWSLYKGRKPYTGKEPERASEYVQGKSDGADLCHDAIMDRGQAPKQSAQDPGAETGPKQAETSVNIGFDGGAQA